MKKQYLIISALFLVSLLVFQACKHRPSFGESAFVSPLEDVKIAFETQIIEAESAQLIRLESGSSIQIPKDAFVDANGNKVRGKMDLGYRQFDDPAEIIASGIPMNFQNEAGKMEQLESGGMFEIQGSVRGEPVFIAPGKSIKTTLASEVAGAYDFYYLEQKEGGESTGSKWKKLTNSIDEIPVATFQAPDSFQAKYNLKDYPNLKTFEGIQWKLWQEEASWNPKTNANSWVLEEAWNRLEFSQPKMALKKQKAILENQKSDLRYSPDQTFFVASNDFQIESYAINGKLLGTTKDVHEYSYIRFLSKEFFTYSDENQDLVISNRYLKKIATIKNAYGLTYQHEKKRFYYLQRKGSDYRKILFKAIDNKGQEVFSNPINFPDGNYSPSTNLFLTNDQKHIFLKTKEGVKIVDLDGTEVALLDREEDYESIYYGFNYNHNDNYYYYNWFYNDKEYSRPSKHDVVTVVKKDGSLMIWDWKKDKKYVTKGVDVREKEKEEDNAYHYHLYLNAHKEHSFVTFREDGAKYSKTWYWEENRIEENTTAIYENVSPRGKFVDVIKEENTDQESGRFSGEVRTYAGKKILEYKDAEFVGEGLEIVNYGQEEQFILISIANGAHRLYNAKGKLIKDFKTYNANIFYSYFNRDETLVYTYTIDGWLACWNLEGTLLWETALNEAIATVYSYEMSIRDASIFLDNDIRKEYDLKGTLLLDYQMYTNCSYRSVEGETMNENMVLKDPLSRHCFAKKEVLPDDPNIYQVTFYKDKKAFTTFVYIDGASKRLVEEYIAEQERLKMEEFARKDVELKLKRSFEIQSFGIYNWDRFYKDESETLVRCEATFNLTTEYNDINVFLITGVEKNAVIQYTKNTFDKFSFNTAYYNKLVAILPNNEIAVFENEDFKKLAIEEIRAKKKHRFELKKMGGVEAMEALKKITAPLS